MQIDRRLVSHFDWTLFLVTLVLIFIGVATIYSANYNIIEEHAGGLATRQVIWLGFGLIAMFVAIGFDYHYIDRLAYPFYGIMLLLLMLVLFVGHSGGGSQRWINLGFFRLQPSEPAKLAIVLVMAKYFQDDEPPQGYSLRDLWVPFALAVPLVGWSLTGPSPGPLTAAWGPADDVSSGRRLRKAYKKLHAMLEAQRIVWFAGRHLPQRITLDTTNTALRLAR